MPTSAPGHTSLSSSAADGGLANVWDETRLTDPHHQPDKGDRVKRMFTAIAGSYDLNNRVHSLGRDQAWRRYAVKMAKIAPGDTAVDVACGTGDLSECLARSAAGQVIGIDFTPGMLEIARQKLARLPENMRTKVSYREGDAQNLDLSSGSADALTIAFGIRNVAEPSKALAEFARVLKPGGRIVILEFDRPRFAPIRWFNDFYCGWVMPRTATLISGDKSGAYRYLPKSVASFWTRPELEQALERAGFREVRSRGLSLGICVCYSATRG